MKNVIADLYHFSSAIATYSFLQGRFLLSFVIFLIFSNFLKFLSYVVPQLVRYLEHAVCNNNNLTPCHLWQTETMLKDKKVSKYFVEDRKCYGCGNRE